MPNTRLVGRPLTFWASVVMVSIGLLTMSRMASGEYLRMLLTTSLTMPAFTPISSSRVMPGFRGMPEVMTTTSDPAVFS